MSSRAGVFLALVAVTVALWGCGEVQGGSQSDDGLPLGLEEIFTQNHGIGEALPRPDAGDGGADEWIAVADLSEGRGLYRLVEDDGEPATLQFLGEGAQPRWSPDGDRVVFVGDGVLQWMSASATSTDDATPLVEGMDGVRAPRFSPDGETVAFYSTDSGYQDIWLVPVDGGESRQLTRGAMPQDDSRFAPAWSPSGSRIAYISNEADWWHDDVWVIDVASGQTRQVSSTLMASSTPVWSPGGDVIALMGTAKDEYWYQDLSYIYVLDLDGGSERTLDMQVWATDRAMSQNLIWSPDGETLYFPYQERGDYDLWAVPADGGVATRITSLGGSMSSIHLGRQSGRLSFVRSGPLEGRELWAISTLGGAPERVTRVSPDFQGVQEPREIYYRSWDGLYIQGFLYLPPDFDSGDEYPALVEVHGGGTNSYLRNQNLTEQYLASRGYVVLAINYRGGSGFGRVFQDLGVEDWLNGQALDAASAADWIRAQRWSNGKVGIYGYSYGGSMSMAAITLAPDRFDAAVPMAGAYTKAETSETEDRLGQIFSVTGHGGTPEERPDTYEKSNTLLRVDQIEAPVLLMHGDADTRVPFEHFELAVEALEEHGKEYETRVFEGEPHGFRNPMNRVELYRALEAFFDRHLRDGGR